MNSQNFYLHEKIKVSTSEGLYFFDPDEIVRLEASSNYTLIYFMNRKPLIIARVLCEFEEMLAILGFVRTHRSHLINARRVMFIENSGKIVMQDTSTAEISRRKRKDVLKKLKSNFYSIKIAA